MSLNSDCDPFPNIPPALLNSADIEDYVKAVGLIDPSNFRPERLKPASYEIGFGTYYAVAEHPTSGTGNSWMWRFHELKEETDGSIIIEPNSIIYVSIDTRINLPPYIAARFNLKIKHVYRGLLAGSGPLVDPGFRGELFVPLHNLSSAQYTFYKGEGFIWMEFTKISPHESWTCDVPETERTGKIVPFPEEKIRRSSLGDYLGHASTAPIRSSVEYALENIREKAEDAEKRAKNAEEQLVRIRKLGTLGAVIAGLALVALVIAMLTLIFSVQNSLNKSENGHLNLPPPSHIATGHHFAATK